MKVGILTLPFVNNYGGILQNYAMQAAIRKCGMEPITLDVESPKTENRTESENAEFGTYDPRLTVLGQKRYEGHFQDTGDRSSDIALRDCPEAMDFLGENLGGTGKVGDYGVITEGILSCKVNTIKPYPAIYAHLLTRYGLIPEETVFVDDTQKNLTAAQAYGIHTILFRSREQVLEELEGIE